MNDGEPGEEIGRLNALSAALLEDFRVIVITPDEPDDAAAFPATPSMPH